MTQTLTSALRRVGIRGMLLSLAAATAIACSPYRIDIQQGNVISAEQLAQLRIGMTRDQVRFVLGTPLLTDVFHERRWDYLYHLEKGKTRAIEQRRLTIAFGADGKVEKIDADAGMKAVPPDATGGVRAYDLTPQASTGDKNTTEKK